MYRSVIVLVFIYCERIVENNIIYVKPIAILYLGRCLDFWHIVKADADSLQQTQTIN